MPTESSIVVEGKITAVLPGTMFRVELSNNHLVLAHLSGKMRKRFIRLTVGDRVKMQMSRTASWCRFKSAQTRRTEASSKSSQVSTIFAEIPVLQHVSLGLHG
jgi:translation initiation factor IF-1